MLELHLLGGGTKATAVAVEDAVVDLMRGGTEARTLGLDHVARLH